jgi:hypothetical protein
MFEGCQFTGTVSVFGQPHARLVTDDGVKPQANDGNVLTLAHHSGRIGRTIATAAVVAVAGAAAGNMSGNADAAAQATNPCARAEALLAAGYPEDALAAFKARLGQGPCAAQGIVDAKAAIAAHASSPTGQEEANKQFTAQVALIRRLQAEGFESAARAKTQTLVEAFPGRTLPADVRAIDQRIGGWRRFQGNVGPVAVSVAEMAIVALGALALLLVVGKGLVALGGRTLLRYTVGAVTGPGDADVKGQDAVLAAELALIAAEGPKHVRRIPAGEGDFTLPGAVADTYPKAAVIAGLLQVLDRVIPRRLLTVSAAVQPTDAERGVGVTVTIAKRGGHEVNHGGQTLWESEFGPLQAGCTVAHRIERLMLPAAIWVGYHPALLGWPRRGLDAIRRHADTARLGTDDWRSYAHFALAARAQTAGDIDAARRGYFKALDSSSDNLGARINLAGLHLYSTGMAAEEPHKDRASRLALAWWLLEDDAIKRAMNPTDNEPAAPFGLRARWLYLRAARDLSDDFAIKLQASDEAASVAQGPKAEADKARSDARSQDGPMALPEPMRDLCNLLSAADDHDVGLATQMRGPAHVLSRSILLEQRKAAAPKDPVDDLLPEHDEWFKATWWTSDTLYNLACFRARYARHVDKDEKTQMLEQAQDALCTAIERSPDRKLMRAMAEGDRTLTDVISEIGQKRLDQLTGKVAPSYKDDEQAGHAIGVKVHEALSTLLAPDANTPRRPAIGEWR